MWTIVYYIGTMLLSLLGLAKHRGRKNDGFVALPFATSQATSTLADNTILLTNITGTLVDPLYVISLDVETAIRDATAGEGPMTYGVSHGDYSVAEILEATVAGQSILGKAVNMIEQERARRKVRKYGILPILAADEFLDDGRPTRVKCGFTVGSGQTLNIWQKNSSGGALTGGAVSEYTGTIYGRWL